MQEVKPLQKYLIRKGITEFQVPKCEYFILDTDAGSDDAQAILLLLHLAEKYNKKILGITCLNGNGYLKDVVINCLITLAVAGKKLPIYSGAAHCLVKQDVKDHYFGHDAFGNQQLDYLKEFSDKLDFNLIQKQNAPEFIVESARKYKGKLGLIMIGPLTNLTLAYYLDTRITEYIEMVSIMGGSYTSLGLERFFASQFNFHVDAESAYVVLKTFRNIYLSTVDYAIDCSSHKRNSEGAIVEKNPLQESFHMDDTPKSKLIRDIFYMHSKKGYEVGYCDPLGIFVAIQPKKHIKTVYQVRAEVFLSGQRTKGFLAIDWNQDVSKAQLKDGVIRIVASMDSKILYEETMAAYKS